MNERVNRALKPDAQAFDEVRIRTVPRWKESGLSGDEWRISATVEFWRKGKLVHETGMRNVETACNVLGWLHADACDNGRAYFAGEGGTCDQEGCADPATVTLRLKHRFCREGHATTPHGIEVRKFCDRHKVRGDCGLDDADVNYEVYGS